MKVPLLLLCTLTMSVSLAAAVDIPSSQRGKELFGSTSLGTSGKSCASCHQNGRGLEQMGSRDHDDLAGTVNQCIRGPLKGKPLAIGSNDLKSLVMYLKTLGSAGK